MLAQTATKERGLKVGQHESDFGGLRLVVLEVEPKQDFELLNLLGLQTKQKLFPSLGGGEAIAFEKGRFSRKIVFVVLFPLEVADEAFEQRLRHLFVPDQLCVQMVVEQGAVVAFLALRLIQEYSDALEEIDALVEECFFCFGAAQGRVLQNSFPVLIVHRLLLLHAVVEDVLLLHLLHIGRYLGQVLVELVEVREPVPMRAEVLLKNLKCKFALEAQALCERKDQVLTHATRNFNLSSKLVLQLEHLGAQ